ncbi:hypothetical protein DBV15_05117 [Temnothorax longispinosus]|uniref:Uncharacterized protein n=1 Tax=Temnothorax longispinosus TaxID=300112 RepID=A0A4S2KU48_9HYME|nr:hypothetical protein DBV15_05117 [Temnothorax longispinosus]
MFTALSRFRADPKKNQSANKTERICKSACLCPSKGDTGNIVADIQCGNRLMASKRKRKGSAFRRLTVCFQREWGNQREKVRKIRGAPPAEDTSAMARGGKKRGAFAAPYRCAAPRRAVHAAMRPLFARLKDRLAGRRGRRAAAPRLIVHSRRVYHSPGTCVHLLPSASLNRKRYESKSGTLFALTAMICKAFFIRHSRKFREAVSDQAGTKPFYGGNFREISDDSAPLTVFGAHFMNACYRVSLDAVRCCILMVTSASFKGHCGGGSGRTNAIAALVFYPYHPRRLTRSSIYARGKRERGKLGAKFVLYCCRRHSRASPIVSCILQWRSYREHHAIREIDIGFKFDRSGLTSDSAVEDDIIVFHRELFRTLRRRHILFLYLPPEDTNSRACIENSVLLDHSGKLICG